MNKKDEGIDIALAISIYLVLDIILLFVLCLIELNGVKHIIILSISFLLEFLATIFLIRKTNLRTALIFYILLLVSPVFLNLITMGMLYITGKIPFTPTLLLLFRSGYTLDAVLLNKAMRLVIMSRLPALIVIIISFLLYTVKKEK